MENFAIACLLVVLSTAVQSDKGGTDLYSSQDDVERLTIDNFKEKVENSSKAWVVEFYMAWCGDCQRFAPSWKALGTDIYSWRDLLQVAVIACSDERNLPICREHEIKEVPTVKYFPENYQSGTQLAIRVNETNEDPTSLRRQLLDRMVTEQGEGRGQMYPNLLPYEEEDLSRLFDGVPEGTKYVFLVMEPPETYLGNEVAMDLHKTPHVVIRHAFYNNTKLVEKLPVAKFPAVVVVDDGGNPLVLPGNPQGRQEVKKDITAFLKSKNMEAIEEKPTKKEHRNETNPYEQAEKKIRELVKHMGDVVFVKDLESALRFALKQEVAMFRSIKGARLDALKAFLNVIRKYFPFSHKSAKLFPKLFNLTDMEEIEGYKIGELVKTGEAKKLFTSRHGYLECRGSEPRFRGYPCSLWKLFHYLTVNANGDPREVLDAMRGYVEQLFSCKDCTENFLEMAARRNLTTVASLNESIMWLWGAHNEVRCRLKGDSTEDPQYPKTEFPTKEACPKCVNKDESWNEAEVLRYLKRVYARHNLRFLGTDSRDFLLAL